MCQSYDLSHLLMKKNTFYLFKVSIKAGQKNAHALKLKQNIKTKSLNLCSVQLVTHAMSANFNLVNMQKILHSRANEI